MRSGDCGETDRERETDRETQRGSVVGKEEWWTEVEEVVIC